jgi:hypothetical protein
MWVGVRPMVDDSNSLFLNRLIKSEWNAGIFILPFLAHHG